ncbi:MAG TPA: Lrp/AsnC family transcriptional regulator [Solirubrobacteraceae bacterium]
MNEITVDDTDRALVTELQADARTSLAELGRRVGLSAPAVGERVGRLISSGVISGFHAEVDARRLGYQFAAIVRVRPASGRIPKVAKIAQDSEEVRWCHRITGEDCFITYVVVRDVEHLEEVIDRFTPFGQTTTSLVQSSPVPGRGVPV